MMKAKVLFVIMRFHHILLLLSLLTSPIVASVPQLHLPTSNTAIFKQRSNDFFMYVDRSFEGKSSKPWQAGTYGFVRNLKRVKGGVIGTRFHEGADIKPVKRDQNGKPLDLVRAVCRGKVVHVNDESRASNYGKYVVLEHNWGEGPIYTLYAHLQSLTCKVGDLVQAKESIGVLGYTGVGLNKKRAHLHFEMALRLSDDFESWHQKRYNTSSKHGNYNGLNLTGIDAIAFIQEVRAKKVTTLKQFLRKQPSYYSILIPSEKMQSFKRRYAWLWEHPNEKTQSVKVMFSASGLPLRIFPGVRSVAEPEVSHIKHIMGRYEDRTIGRISGTGDQVKITARGKRYLALLMGES